MIDCAAVPIPIRRPNLQELVLSRFVSWVSEVDIAIWCAEGVSQTLRFPKGRVVKKSKFPDDPDVDRISPVSQFPGKTTVGYFLSAAAFTLLWALELWRGLHT